LGVVAGAGAGSAKYEVRAVPVLDVVRGLKERAAMRREALRARRRGGKNVVAEGDGEDGGKGAQAAKGAVPIRRRLAAREVDETVNVQILTTLDPRMADQQLRASVQLPHKVGKAVRVCAMVTSEVERQAAIRAGAEDYGSLEAIVAMVKRGEIPFTKAVATPEALREVGPLIGKILGPKGLMPNVKQGEVDKDITVPVRALAAGSSVVMRTSKAGEVSAGVGKVSMSEQKIVENLVHFVKGVFDHKPEKVGGYSFCEACHCMRV